MADYIKRCVDSILDFRLQSTGAVWVRGPKWCGKSTTAQQHAASSVYLHDETTKAQNIALAQTAPSVFLDGKPPMLIDEWQVVPSLWNQVRYEVDRRGEFGQFILTGSAQPDLSSVGDLHTGTGRISDVVMRPMTLQESGESTAAVSLQALFSGDAAIGAKVALELPDYAFFTARGGWPTAIGKNEKVALQQAKNFYSALVQTDISEVDGIRREEARVRLLMRSYARNCGTQASNATIRRDMIANDTSTLNEDTIFSYINALKGMYVVEESPAWNPNLRSATAVRTANTRYFVDPSIACAALGVGPSALVRDLQTFGLLFENLCIRDLRVYSEVLDGRVLHFRDGRGRECDAVIVLPDGSWGAVEVKLGAPDAIDEAAKNLLAIAADIDSRLPAPSFLMVLTGMSVAYRRDDGVLVVPIGALGG